MDSSGEGFPSFSEWLDESSPFRDFTGKGFIRGRYVGKPCKWRDDPKAFSGFAGKEPDPVDIPPLPAEVRTGEDAKAFLKGFSGKVDVPWLGQVNAGLKGLFHGTRAYGPGKLPEKGVDNLAVAQKALDLLKSFVPVQFLSADSSDSGKPVKGVIVAKAFARFLDDRVLPVRLVITVSAVCDFRKESGWELEEIYSLHAINVNPAGGVEIKDDGGRNA